MLKLYAIYMHRYFFWSNVERLIDPYRKKLLRTTKETTTSTKFTSSQIQQLLLKISSSYSNSLLLIPIGQISSIYYWKIYSN